VDDPTQKTPAPNGQQHDERNASRGLRRALWFALGALCLSLGVIGAVLPLLPTTPFVIAAAFAFGKSAPGVARRLEESRAFGPIIADWRAHGAIAPRYKAVAVTMMVAVFALSVAMALPGYVLVVQAICLTGAGAFVLSRASRPAR
jgi:uncharacterized protein